MTFSLDFFIGLFIGVAVSVISVALYRKRAYRRLNTLRDQFNTLINAVPCTLSWVGENRTYLGVNEKLAKAFGLEPNEFIGKKIGFLSPDGQFPDFVDRLFNSEETFISTEYSSVSQGKKSTFFILAQKYMKGKAAMIVGIDITEQKNNAEEKEILESQLFQKSKMEAIGNLAGGIAHDINNCLSPISMCAEMFARDEIEPDKIRKYGQIILSSAERAGKMVGELLTFSRNQEKIKSSFNLDEVVEECVNLLTHSLEKTIAIDKKLELPPHRFIGDRTKILNVFINLGVNARDAMPNGGEVLVTSRQTILGDESYDMELAPGHYAYIEVKDTGLGISKEDQAKIFDPFFTTKEEGRGTGLGLATAYGTVKSHLGMIKVKSDATSGTIFQIYLPIKLKESENNKSYTDSFGGAFEKSRKDTFNGKIFLVDDDREFANLTAEALSHLGYQVDKAYSGEEALAQLGRDLDPDVMLMDLIMPGENGLQILEKVKKIKPKLPVILISGMGSQPDIEASSLKSVAGYVGKPINFKSLGDKILDCLIKK